MIAQAGVMMIPSFLFEFRLELFYNENHSFTSDPETKSEADAALSLAFDGVALTFVSTLFVFMLHGIAPGVFMGSCVFCWRSPRVFDARNFDGPIIFLRLYGPCKYRGIDSLLASEDRAARSRQHM